MSRSLKEWQEEIAANMLEDLEKLSGIPFEEILASEVEEDKEFEPHPIYEEETESEELDMHSRGGDIDDYLDDYVDDYDIADEEDAYGDEAL